MIYLSFLYFFVSVLLFSYAPVTAGKLFSTLRSFTLFIVILSWFWFLCRSKFMELHNRLENDELSISRAQRQYSSRINTFSLFSLILFAVEIFILDLKTLIVRLSVPGYSEFLVTMLGLGVFLLHVGIMWYWGFRAMGKHLDLGATAEKYIMSNIRFNIVMVLPVLILYFIADLVGALNLPFLKVFETSPLFQLGAFLAYLVCVVLFGPLVVARMWDCKPLPPSQLRDDIEEFCREKGVKFREIVSWNALNKGLVTAGVMGVTGPFRYLMITPGLMNLLDHDELMGVVCHEVGHVRKKHHFLYLLFFVGFIFAVSAMEQWMLQLFFTTSPGLSLIMSADGTPNFELVNILKNVFSITMLVLYFRYVFGYFMRNFERQADGYCFEAGIDPQFLISSFMKLGAGMGDSAHKRNWHHYNIPQRIDFLRKGMENPGLMQSHNQTIKRGLAAFTTVLVLLTAFSFNYFSNQTYSGLNLERLASLVEKRLEKFPEKSELYTLLGQVYFELNRWKDSKKAYEYAVGIKYEQPEVLNNLAWLLLKTEDESLRNPKRALKLAKDAVVLNEAVHIVDTLAEAYYQNEHYWEAYTASKKALQMATDNRSYFEEQYDKMKKAMERYGKE